MQRKAIRLSLTPMLASPPSNTTSWPRLSRPNVPLKNRPTRLKSPRAAAMSSSRPTRPKEKMRPTKSSSRITTYQLMRKVPPSPLQLPPLPTSQPIPPHHQASPPNPQKPRRKSLHRNPNLSRNPLNRKPPLLSSPNPTLKSNRSNPSRKNPNQLLSLSKWATCASSTR